ncbi:hypothetical protein L9F63_005895, partial [Diploptera punctata]
MEESESETDSYIHIREDEDDVSNSSRNRKKLQECLKKPAGHKEMIEIKDILARYSTDIIASCAFGIECNCLKNPDAEFRNWGRKIFERNLKNRIVRFISLTFPKLSDCIKLSVLPKEISLYFREMVKDTVEYREKNKVHRNDFMQLMIQLKNKTLGAVEDDPLLKMPTVEINGLKSNIPFEITMDVIAAQAFVFFIAGFETSSTTMTFCLYEMACNPDIQARLRKEIDSVLAKYNGQITYETIHEIAYLDKTNDQTLRKYPAVPLLTRECTQTIKLRDTDLVVDKGTQIILPIYALHHDPKYYPDPEKFDPERFNEEEVNKRPHFAYLPFGEGPRLCIGMRFGLMQTKVGLITILSNYEVQVSEKTPIPLKYDPQALVLAPLGGMWLKIVNRNVNVLPNSMAFLKKNMFIFVKCVILGLTYLYFQGAFTYWKKKGVPTLKPIIPFGDFFKSFVPNYNDLFMFQGFYDAFEGEKYGGLYNFTKPSLMIKEPELIKNILVKDFDSFHSRGLKTTSEKIEPLTGHLFFLSGSKWRNLRVKLTPTFTSGKMKMMFPTLVETGKKLQECLKKPAEHKEIIEIKDILARYSTDVIASCAFGIGCNCLKNPDAEFRNWGRKIFERNWKHRIIRFIAVTFPKLSDCVNISVLPKEVSLYFREMVKDTVEYREKNKVHRNDFMQLMIQLKNKTLGASNTPFEITMDVIAAQAFVFFIAGFETSSTTMTFCLYEMACNPDIQARLRKEIDSVLAKYNGQITYETIHEIFYFIIFFTETLRKYPAVPLLTRQCTETIKLRDTDLVVDKGTQIFLPIYALHHDPKYYPDPEKFDPERFNEEEVNKRPHFSYLPFGEGPRLCIGMRFGLMQTKIGLISILSKYEIQVSEKTPIPIKFDPKPSTVLGPHGGMWLKIFHHSKTIGLFGVVSALVYLYFQEAFLYWNKKGVPTLKPIVPFGDFLKSLQPNHNPLFLFHGFYNAFEGEKIGGVYRFTKPNLVIRDPEIIKNIFIKDFENFHSRASNFDDGIEPLNDHLFFLSGSKWRNLRMKLTPTFTSGKIKMMFPILVETGKELQRILKKNAISSEEVEIKDILARYSTDVIASCAFGIDCNCLKNPNAEFRNWGRRIFESSLTARVLRIASFTLPVINKFISFAIVPKDVSIYFRKMVRETVEYREENNVHRNDFMQLLIQLKNKTLGASSGLKSNSPFEVTMDVIAAQAFVFFIAGFETSSTTVTFCLYELACNPDIQARLREEIDTVLNKYNGDITYEAVNEMNYLEKVVNETLRMYPPLSTLTRECTRTTKLRDTDVVIEKGTPIILSIYGLQRDPKYFPNPEVFDPERFNEEEVKKRPPFCYLPFGEGPRLCIGMRFGMMQVKVAVISVLLNYEIQTSDKTPTPLEYDPKSIFLSPKDGMCKIQYVCILVLALSFILGCIYVYFKKCYSYWEKLGVPTMQPTIPFGNFSDALLSSKMSPFDCIANLYKAFEGHPVAGVYRFDKPALLVRDPEIIKDVLVKDFDSFYSRGIEHDERNEPLQANLFSLNGPKWRNLRVKLSPTFTSGKMRMMFPTLVACGKELTKCLEEPSKKGELEIKEYLARYSTDIIASCAFGVQCNCLNNPKAEFRLWGRKIFAANFKSWLFRIFFFIKPELIYSLKFTFIPKDVSRYFRNMVKETVEFRSKNNVQRNDFMQLLIQLKDKKLGVAQDDNATNYMTMDLVAAQAFVFFIAVFETSSTTVSYALYEMALQKDIQDRVREEIDNVLEKHGGEITYESLMEMRYLDKVVAETLRKYPPLPAITRQCSKPTKLRGTDLTVEAGMHVLIPVMGLQHDPKYFPNPKSFDPERFNEEEKKKRPHFCYLPFGEGGRICIAFKFGLMQSKVALISILRKYEVHISEKTKIPLVYDPKSLVLSPVAPNFLQ